MKLQRFIRWGSVISLGISGVSVAVSACWLYSWRWGGTPVAHASLTAEEARILTDYDDFLATRAVLLYRDEISQLWELNGMDDGEETPWMVKLALRLTADVYSRDTLGPHRELLHAFLTKGTEQKIPVGMALYALIKQDVKLFKLLLDKASDLKEPVASRSVLSALAYATYPLGNELSVAERLELLDWLYSRGVDIHCLPPHKLLDSVRHTLLVSDDVGAAVFDWFLRHGYQVDQQKALTLLLNSAEALPTLQKLVADGFLPVPTESLAPYFECSPLQFVASRTRPLPDTVRWLLSLGHNVHGQTFKPDIARDLPEFFRHSTLDVCVMALQNMYHDNEDAAGYLDVLSVLLQHGAVPSAKTKSLLPRFDAELRNRVVKLMEQHGYYILTWENSCNACCQP